MISKLLTNIIYKGFNYQTKIISKFVLLVINLDII